MTVIQAAVDWVAAVTEGVGWALFMAYRRHLGVSASTSGAMLTLPKHFFGFGFTSLKERYLDISLRTIKRTLSTNSIPGQLGRAVLSRHLGIHGNLPTSITEANWKSTSWLRPWLRKFQLIYSMGGTLDLSMPNGFGGPRDDILALLDTAPDPCPASDHLPHLRRLWTLGLLSVAQLTVPGSARLYTLEDFNECFPSADADSRDAFSTRAVWAQDT